MAESGRKSPDGNKSFKSTPAKNQSDQKQENIASNLSANKKRSNAAKNKPRNNNKIEEIKSMGQAFISRYFRGFTSEERANIKADLDDTLPYRIIENYQHSIRTYAEHKDWNNANEYSRKLDVQLFGAISLGLAIKLNASSTDTEKKANRLLSALDTKIILPKKLGVILDQIGKTDIPGDNHYRIRNQNFAAKRHLAKAVHNLIPQEELQDWMNDNYGQKLADFNQVMENHDLFSNMVDDTSWSINRIQEIGKQRYKQMTEENFEFWKKGTNRDEAEAVYTLRLPKVNFETLDLATIGAIMSNGVFTDFSFNTEFLTSMASGLVLSIAKYSWVKKPMSKMEELEEAFGGTWFEGKTFKDILTYCGIWNIGYFFDDLTFNNLALEAVKRWNNAYSKPFNMFLQMAEIPFGDHGTDSQLIQIDRSEISKKNNLFGYPTYSMIKKTKASTVLKIGENNALLGTMVGYSKNLSFESDWNVEFNHNNKAILYEFLKNDFKDGY